MRRKDFIPILECALKSADPRVTEVCQSVSDPNEICVFLDDERALSTDISGCSLLDVIETVVFTLKIEHQKRRLGVKPQYVTRRGVRFNGKWYCTEQLLIRQGQQVYVIPCGCGLMIQEVKSGRYIAGIVFD